jgi:hypothetical protein
MAFTLRALVASRHAANGTGCAGRRDGVSDGEESLVRLTSGAVAGAVATTLCYPLDLVRTRLTTQVKGRGLALV